MKKARLNKHSKGSKLELQARKDLESEGWLVEKKPWSRFESKDFWKCFDLLAINKGLVKCVQVKSNQARKSEVKKLFQPIKEHIPKSWILQIWVHEDNKKGWKKYNIRTL